MSTGQFPEAWKGSRPFCWPAAVLSGIGYGRPVDGACRGRTSQFATAARAILDKLVWAGEFRCGRTDPIWPADTAPTKAWVRRFRGGFARLDFAHPDSVHLLRFSALFGTARPGAS